jgi:hypothetical protein
MERPRLREILWSKRIRSGQTSEHFIPESELNSVITPTAILEEIQTASIYHNSKDDVIRLVLRSARKVFAILAYIGRLDALPDFLEQGLTDISLPMVKIAANPPEPIASTHSDDGFPRWDEIGARFEDCQWLFLSPVFDKPGGHLDIPSRCPLPFTYQEHFEKGPAGSALQRVKFHASHQKIFKPHGVRLPAFCKQSKITS